MGLNDVKAQSLLPGTRIEIRPFQEVERAKKTGEEVHLFETSLYDVLPDGGIEINVPIVKEQLALLPMAIRYEVIFITEKGLVRGVGMMEKRYKREKFPLFLFRPEGALEKYQRREFYRLDCYIPLLYVTLSEEAASIKSMKEVRELLQGKADEDRIMGKGTILDISGGGIRFITSKDLSAVHYLLLEFPIEGKAGKEKIEVIGRVKGSSLVKGTDNSSYRIQILFKDSDAQERIVHYIFEEERRIRQKERG